MHRKEELSRRVDAPGRGEIVPFKPGAILYLKLRFIVLINLR
jgi:hypothetical protein